MRPSSPGSDPQPIEPSWRTRLPFYYGWVVVASAFVVLAVSYGVYYSFSVFYVALLEEFGWGRAGTAGVYSVNFLVTGLVGALSGNLIDRFGPSRVVPIGALTLAASLVACSRITELWQFYLAFGVLGGIGMSLSGWVPAVAVVSAWFSARRGLAIGIASAGIGLGTVGFVPMSQYLISTAGWRSAYLVLGAISLLVSAPIAALTQVGRPEKLGLKVDGASAKPASPEAVPPKRRIVIVDRKWASFPWTLGDAIRTNRFWLMGGTIMMNTLTNQMLWAHQAAYLVDSGFDRMLAASAVGLAGLLSMPAKVIWGSASDRYGRERTFTAGVATLVISIVLLVAVGQVRALPILGLFVLGFAFGYAINAPLSPVSAGDLFGGRHFGGIFGTMNVGGSLGGAFGVWLAGFIFDVTGSYYAAFATAATSSAMSILFIWLAAPRKVRRVVRE